MPTALRPGIGASIRISRAASSIFKLSEIALIFDTFTLESGRISNLVTAGPICVATSCALMPKLPSTSISFLPLIDAAFWFSTERDLAWISSSIVKAGSL